MSTNAATVASKTRNNPAVEYGARAGYALSGLIHLVIGYLAVKVAWFSDSANLDQSGALGTVARQPGGKALLLGMVIAFVLLAVFYLTDAAVGQVGGDGLMDRAQAAGKAVFYLVLAYTAFSFVQGGGKSGSKSTTDATATLMGAPGGRFVVGAIGVGVVVAGGYHVYKGVARKFCDDLEDDPGTVATIAGTYGYAAKGIALGVVGALFVVAAAQSQPKEAKGLDGALHTLIQQPFGPVLLTLVALGFVAFGVYCFARARHLRT